jgi:transposase
MAGYSHQEKGDGTMPTCKKCGSGQTVKKWCCGRQTALSMKECGCNFREGDSRTNETVAAKKALCIPLYAMAKGSFRMMGKILNINRALVYRRVRNFGESLPEPVVSGKSKQMEFDEIWHFVGSKKENFGSSKPLTVAHGELWLGCSAIVILKPFDGSMIRSPI